MKLSITLLSLVAAQATCSAIHPSDADEACFETPENCLKHPTELGIKSPLYDPSQGETESSAENVNTDMGLSPRDDDGAMCPLGKGRGTGMEYDYGCDEGWCWRNCRTGPTFPMAAKRKPWCWLKYEAGVGGWTPCGRWQDCKFSYDKKNAKCAKKKKGCGECGCGC
ncbi:uncharacterized protein FTOL_02787 [Fusarium torulosum]|uniref:Uncharacterized protein n=1 Tax=Fusarium torulosum TaxID=33205 RepID=A0AAE8M3F8_9HYPO|nr:uncharacterized protein FTOL_02787 [Fusarium torulosum]